MRPTNAVAHSCPNCAFLAMSWARQRFQAFRDWRLVIIAAKSIRDRYITQLRALYKGIKRMEKMYRPFPDAPADAWRDGITVVAQKIKQMTDAELLATKGTDMVLRNLVADEMGIPRCTPDGRSYGHRILDVTWG